LIQVNVSENSRPQWKIARLMKARPSTCDDMGGLCLVAGQGDVARANLAVSLPSELILILLMRNAQANLQVST
jgi:hypothetical protein